MPDVEWIMENCHMMRDNGVWAGEKRKDGTYYLHGASKHYGRN